MDTARNSKTLAGVERSVVRAETAQKRRDPAPTFRLPTENLGQRR